MMHPHGMLHLSASEFAVRLHFQQGCMFWVGHLKQVSSSSANTILDSSQHRSLQHGHRYMRWSTVLFWRSSVGSQFPRTVDTQSWHPSEAPHNFLYPVSPACTAYASLPSLVGAHQALVLHEDALCHCCLCLLGKGVGSSHLSLFGRGHRCFGGSALLQRAPSILIGLGQLPARCHEPSHDQILIEACSTVSLWAALVMGTKLDGVLTSMPDCHCCEQRLQSQCQNSLLELHPPAVRQPA